MCDAFKSTDKTRHPNTMLLCCKLSSPLSYTFQKRSMRGLFESREYWGYKANYWKWKKICWTQTYGRRKQPSGNFFNIKIHLSERENWKENYFEKKRRMEGEREKDKNCFHWKMTWQSAPPITHLTYKAPTTYTYRYG